MTASGDVTLFLNEVAFRGLDRSLDDATVVRVGQGACRAVEKEAHDLVDQQVDWRVWFLVRGVIRGWYAKVG